jgi:hypothetical protein
LGTRDAKVPAEWPESEARYVVDDDGSGRELDPRNRQTSSPIVMYRWELLSVDRSSVVEDDAQRTPIRRGHPVRKLRRVLDVSG